MTKADGKNTLPGVPPPAPGSSPTELPAAAARDEITRPEHDIPAAHAPDSRRRGDYPTVPGGGTNRLSGGRDAASAYVGVRTVAPHMTSGTSGSTVSIRIEDKLANESRRHATEPRLPRSVSVAPPPPLRDPEARPKGVAILVALLALAVGGLAAVLLREPEGESATWDSGIDGHPSSIEQAPARDAKRATSEPVSEKIVALERNDASPRPNGPSAAPSGLAVAPPSVSSTAAPAAAPPSPRSQPSAATVSVASSSNKPPAPRNTPAPKQTTSRSSDPAPAAPQHENWLE